MTSATGHQWLKITLFCPRPLLEPASDLMGVLSGTGVEQSPENEDGALISGFFQLGMTENALAADEASELLARVEREMTELFALYDCGPAKATAQLLADQDWATCWQQYFKPDEIVPGLVIKPSWENYWPEPGQAVIEMDPGMAFGTGQHASTRMALALIRQCLETGPCREALDVGTGTGILAMAAALSGVERVVAIDNDPDAVAVARGNIANNGLAGKIEIGTTPVDHIQGTFPLICANIVHDVLVDMAPTLARLTAPGGHLVLAGILSGDQEANIIRVYRQFGLQSLTRLHQEEWAALLLRRE
ncbi:MAG: 50S ribosomal protein L11 methyltransferase [Desulfobulbus sp.]|jgi:ribosomal protein L11 methyltransferase|uniref:50S ribosomal protein L11 methyltransferase n=1 Tax=Desulfobulbus sp. TaxID=895 RepID=UPI0028491D12|nr:50S ribosomal protein L11 methyltransferase [Desulfobulbus sp.]MDR2548620.1 50S ribosomal protein L11 methyltransferase [Desulfobulbus sp.]